jgi:hypothetical protein
MTQFIVLLKIGISSENGQRREQPQFFVSLLSRNFLVAVTSSLGDRFDYSEVRGRTVLSGDRGKWALVDFFPSCLFERSGRSFI